MAELLRTRGDDPTYVEGMTPNREPAFETTPSANDITHWFVENMRHESNASGDAWWLSREPHSYAYMVAHIDRDTQEFWLLDITTTDPSDRSISDLLWVMHGLDGDGVDWWQHPICHVEVDASTSLYWTRDGIAWMADQMVVHYEYLEMKRKKDQG